MKLARVLAVGTLAAALATLAAPGTAAVQEQVSNGGFEQGSSPIDATDWDATANGGPGGSRCPEGPDGCQALANHGDYFGIVGPFSGAVVPPNTVNYDVGSLSQVVDVPESPVVVSFSYRRTDFNEVNETELAVTLGYAPVVTITDAPAGVFTPVTVTLPPEAVASAATLAFSATCHNVTSATIECDRYDIDDVSVQTGSDTDPPSTKITKAPTTVRLARGARKAPVKIRFTSDEAGSTFECKQDAKAWRACTSPHTFRLAEGEHLLRVRATDIAGNVDPTPAKVTVRVKPHR